MDRSHPQVIALTAALAGMDDDALATLANKGLVRRAKKDIEKSPPKLTDAAADFVSLDVEDAKVHLIQPLNKSTCSCASGICRHILAAIIFLRDSAPAPAPARDVSASEPAATPHAPSPPSTDPAADLLSLTDDAIEKWAGRTIMRRTAIVLSRGYEIEEPAGSIIVRLPAQNITVRCLPGGLDALLCACHAPAACEHKAAAVLALRAHRKGEQVQIADQTLKASQGAPRSRDQIRQSVSELLYETIAIGLSRLSSSVVSRLRTLATSAHGVDLPRLSRMLKSLADEAAMAIKQDASSSSAALLISCARLAALCEALEAPAPALVGEHRSLYLPVAGSIEVAGMGAKRWRTRSGYHGITACFWEPTSRRWTAWNDARPIGTPGFDPVSRFDESGPWSGAPTLRHAVQNCWRLTGLHRNAAGRITSRENSRGIPMRRATPEDGPVIRDFTQLAPAAAKAFAPGLADRTDHADLVLLAPAQVLPANYDPIRQEVTRTLIDANGQLLTLLLQHSPETDHALTTLQQVDSASITAVLGSMRIGPRGLWIEPITLFTPDKPIHLTLDGAPRTAATTATFETDPESDDDESEEDDLSIDSSSPIGHLLALVEDYLLAIAESGVSVIRDLSPLGAAAQELSSLGLKTASNSISHLCQALDTHRKSIRAAPTVPAAALLHAAYIIHLSGVCQTVTRATATL